MYAIRSYYGLTAGLFHAVVDENLEILAPLNHLIAGGDTLSPKHVCCFKKAFPSIRLTNGYGPTENTTFSCCYEIPEHQRDDTSVPIGKAIANSQTYILDSHLNYTPIGVPGELYRITSYNVCYTKLLRKATNGLD